MAPKRHLEENPPPASSSSEEESENDAVNEEEEEEEEENGAVEGADEEEKTGDDEDEEDGDDGDDEEEEKEKPSLKKCSVSSSSKITKPKSPPVSRGESDESGSESGSDSERTNPPSPADSGFTIKPIVSKPIDKDSDKPNKKGSARPNTSSAATTHHLKRAAESNLNGKDSKKKKTAADDEDTKKASGFQRLWSEDDEVAILKGMIDYQSKKGLDPYSDMSDFHEFIKNNLHVDVSMNQLKDKIRRLKKKYQVNADKSENDEDPIFSKAHERKSFELSKKIWGAANANGTEDNAKSNKKNPRQSDKSNNSTSLALQKEKEKASVNGKVESDPEFWAKFPYLHESLKLVSNNNSASENVVNTLNQVIPLIGSSKVKELEKRWKNLHLEEVELYIQRSELVQEQVKMVLDSIKSS